jgi:hypothetical protein
VDGENDGCRDKYINGDDERPLQDRVTNDCEHDCILSFGERKSGLYSPGSLLRRNRVVEKMWFPGLTKMHFSARNREGRDFFH